MQIIVSHVNTDFDALASMVAAKKVYPNAKVVISNKQSIPVRRFLTIYRDTLDLVQDNAIDWSNVTELILVDEASLARIGDDADKLQIENLKVTVYDHHPAKEGDVESDDKTIELVGATVTLLVEKIQQSSITISPFEATLFGLGIYTDTGAFTYKNTTARDLRAASYLMEQGMNLEVIQHFSDVVLLPEQQEILNQLFQQSKTYSIDSLQIIVSSYKHHKFKKGLAIITQKLLKITDADAVLTVVEMGNRIYIVGRSRSDRITLLPLLKKWNGGGHEQAGSAAIKNAERTAILNEVITNLELMLKPATTASSMMTTPVKTILPEMSIKEAGLLMYRYGHSGFPVVKDDKLLGIITRRDLEKANHHGLGHAPVKGYMSTSVKSIQPETTEEEIQEMIIEHNIGRLPVVEDGKLIGIVTRTNLIEMLHNQKLQRDLRQSTGEVLKSNLLEEMKKQLPEKIYSLLKDISYTANDAQESVYLIGGIVRDVLLGASNDDIDIVVEGNGIAFSKKLQKDYGGEVTIHKNFGTATWTHPTGYDIDVTSSRLEYYEYPAALPDVETSTLKEDLYRRDFTINAMAIYLNKKRFGQLVDPFQGREDLQNKRIKILHNISFIEDPTRILRAVRFELRFQFLMDEQTENLALQSIERVKALSTNRIVDEMVKLFTEGHPAKAIDRLFELEFWQQLGVSKERAPSSFQYANQLDTLYKKNKTYLASCKPSWFHYFLIPFFKDKNIKLAKKFALTKNDAKFLQEINELINLPQWMNIEKAGELHRFLKDFSNEAILFVIAKESFIDKQPFIEYIRKRHKLPVFLTGKDLIKQGLKPSPFFSDVLLDLDVAVLNGEVETRDEANEWLVNQIKKWEEKA